MQGTILEFNTTSNQGIISSSDSGRYSFTIEQWKSSSTKPKTGMSVDFIVNNNIATEIYSISAPNCANIISSVSEKSVPIIKAIFKLIIIVGVLLFITVNMYEEYESKKAQKDDDEYWNAKIREEKEIVDTAQSILKSGNSLLKNKQFESAIKTYNTLKYTGGFSEAQNEQLKFNKAYAFYKLKQYKMCDGYDAEYDAEYDTTYPRILGIIGPESYVQPASIDIIEALCSQKIGRSANQSIEDACSKGDCNKKVPLEQKVENYYRQLNP